MAIYEPIQDGTGVYSGGVGKDSPYGKATGLYTPRLAGSRSRVGTIIEGMRFGYRAIRKHYKLSTGIGVIATGAGVRYATKGTYRKALRQRKSVYNNRRRSRKQNNSNCCCVTRRKHSYRSSRRRYS